MHDCNAPDWSVSTQTPGIPVTRFSVPLVRVNGQQREMAPGEKISPEFLPEILVPAPEFSVGDSPVSKNSSAIRTIYYGGVDSYLGTPAKWVDVKVGGSTYKIPVYEP